MNPHQPSGESNDQPAVIPDDVTPRLDPSLVVFDFDGTLTHERGGWELLGERFGIADALAGRTEAFEREECTFAEWCQGNIDDLRAHGVTEADLVETATEIELTPGVETVIQTLEGADIPYGVISGGVLNLTTVLDRFEPSFVHSNEINFDVDGRPITVDAKVGPNDKDVVLQEACERLSIDLEDVLYVGDSYTDTDAFAVAGTGIWFCPDDRLSPSDQQLGDYLIRERDLQLLVPCLQAGRDRTRP